MSGGYFNYRQSQVSYLASEIDALIERNDDKSKDSYGYQIGHEYPPEIIERFREAAHTLRQAAEMAQRIDWLVSGDDGEDSFMARWDKEVRPYWSADLAKQPTTDGPL